MSEKATPELIKLTVSAKSPEEAKIKALDGYKNYMAIKVEPIIFNVYVTPKEK